MVLFMDIEIKFVGSEEDYQKCLAIRRKVFIEGMNVSEQHEIDAYEKKITPLPSPL